MFKTNLNGHVQFLMCINDFPYTSYLIPMLEWCEGLVTEYLVATFGDYFTDVKM